MTKLHSKIRKPILQLSASVLGAGICLFSSIQLCVAESDLRDVTGGGCPCGNGTPACSTQNSDGNDADDVGPTNCTSNDQCAIYCSPDTAYSCNGQGFSKNCKTDSENCITTPSTCVNGECQQQNADPNNDACGQKTYCGSN